MKDERLLLVFSLFIGYVFRDMDVAVIRL